MSKLEELTIVEVLDVLSEFDFHLVSDGVMPGLDGYCDCQRKKIYVNGDQEWTDLRKTIIHELSHAYHFTQKVEDTEEDVTRVEEATYQTYREAKE